PVRCIFGFALTVVDDVCDLIRHEEGIDAGVIETGALAGCAAFGIAHVVLHEDREVVEPLQTVRPQQVPQLVAASFQFAVGQDLAAARRDDSRSVRLQARVPPGYIARLPSSFFLTRSVMPQTVRMRAA